MVESLAQRRRVNLADYELSTTLGTGKFSHSVHNLAKRFNNNSVTVTLKFVCLGSFGRVMLAKNRRSGEFFAMKRLKKSDIIKLRQVDHVISENTILADIEHPLLVSFFSITSNCLN